MKKSLILFGICLLFIAQTTRAFASDSPALSINILSPEGVKGGLPGREEIISAEITNHTNQPIDDVMAYITMCDLDKHMTVNLEDYSADKPVTITTLQPGETRKIELPIRLVYVDHFYLYVTAASRNLEQIYSSKPIPIEILGNTLVNKTLVQITSISVPVILIFIITYILIRYNRRRKIA